MDYEYSGAMKKILAIIMFLMIALLCGGANYYRELLMLPRVVTGGDLHWFDPYSTNAIGTTLLIDWPTNTIAARGSIGSAWDAGATNGVATAHVVSNSPSVANGPAQVVIGTNSLGEVNYGWQFDGTNDFIHISDRDDLSFGNFTNTTASTIYGWFREEKPPSNVTEMYYFNKNAYLNREYYMYRSTSGDLSVYYFSTNAVVGLRWYNTSIPASSVYSNWIFWVSSFAGKTGAASCVIYTNAVAISLTYTHNPLWTAMGNGNSPLFIGKDDGAISGSGSNRLFKGTMAFVGIIQTNLTSTEVTDLFLGLGGTNGPGAAIRKRQPTGAYP
jgi:hypothetical protein